MPLSPYTRFLTFLKSVCELYQFPDTIDDEDNFTTRLYNGVVDIVDGHNPSTPEDWKHVYSDVERLMVMWDIFAPKVTSDAAAYLQLSQLIMEQLEQNQNPPFKIDPPVPFSSYAPANVAVVPCEVPNVAVVSSDPLRDFQRCRVVSVAGNTSDAPETIDVESVTGVTEDGEPSATPEESEEVPATPEEVPATPEESEEVPATPEESEEVPATPEEVPATLEESEEVPATPEKVPATPEEVPATLEEVPATLEEVPATPEIPATPEEVPATPEIPATPEEVPATPEKTTEIPATPEETTELPATPEETTELTVTPEEETTEEEEVTEQEEEEEGMEVEPIKIKGKNYWIDTATHKLYAVVGEDDVGDEVGAIVAGKAVFI